MAAVYPLSEHVVIALNSDLSMVIDVTSETGASATVKTHFEGSKIVSDVRKTCNTAVKSATHTITYA